MSVKGGGVLRLCSRQYAIIHLICDIFIPLQICSDSHEICRKFYNGAKQINRSSAHISSTYCIKKILGCSSIFTHTSKENPRTKLPYFSARSSSKNTDFTHIGKIGAGDAGHGIFYT